MIKIKKKRLINVHNNENKDFNNAVKSSKHKKTEPNLDSVSLYFI